MGASDPHGNSLFTVIHIESEGQGFSMKLRFLNQANLGLSEAIFVLGHLKGGRAEVSK